MAVLLWPLTFGQIEGDRYGGAVSGRTRQRRRDGRNLV
jgi:hypothetical protein